MKPKTVGAAQFRRKGLALLDQAGTEGIIITRHGEPVAKLLPIESDSADRIGSLKDKIKIHGNTLSTEIKWDARS